MYEHLSDPNPPDLDGALRHRVALRARTRQRRVRLAASSVALTPMLIIGALGVYARGQANDPARIEMKGLAPAASLPAPGSDRTPNHTVVEEVSPTATSLDVLVGSPQLVDVTTISAHEPAATAAPVSTVTKNTAVPVITVVQTTVPPVTIAQAIDGAGAGTPFCLANESLNSSEGPVSRTAEDAEWYYTGLFSTWLGELANNAPPALATDVNVVVRGLEHLIDVLEQNQWDVDVAYVETRAVFESAEYTLAQEHINAYCGW